MIIQPTINKFKVFKPKLMIDRWEYSTKKDDQKQFSENSVQIIAFISGTYQQPLK